jgi:ABC-type Na+ transport system ATPase subunit NatA
MTVAIQTEGLTKSFGSTRALDGVDLAVESGTVPGLLGPDGAGKTTAVRIMATLLGPTTGRARVGGYDLVRQPQQVRQLIGLTGRGRAWPGERSMSADVSAQRMAPARVRTGRITPGLALRHALIVSRRNLLQVRGNPSC